MPSTISFSSTYSSTFFILHTLPLSLSLSLFLSLSLYLSLLLSMPLSLLLSMPLSLSLSSSFVVRVPVTLSPDHSLYVLPSLYLSLSIAYYALRFFSLIPRAITLFLHTLYLIFIVTAVLNVLLRPKNLLFFSSKIT